MNFRKITELRPQYLLRKSIVTVDSSSSLKVGRNCRITNARIDIRDHSQVILGDGVKISNIIIIVENGELKIGNQSDFGKTRDKSIINISHGKATFEHCCEVGKNSTFTELNINKGTLLMKDHSKFSGSKLWIRFGGVCKIGSYTNINHGTEIRCDEGVSIGDYVMISYNIRIWDTTTHQILSPEKRRKLTFDYWPGFGIDLAKPTTKPIIIGNDCWIGEQAAILKGTEIGNGSTIGFRTILTGQQVPPRTTAINQILVRLIPLHSN